MARRSPRQEDTPPELSSVLPPPRDLSEDSLLTLIDTISSLLSSPGWRWLIDTATTEWGSKAVRARLHTADAGNLELAALGALTQSTLASALAIERLLNMPNETLTRLRIEQHRIKRQREA